MQYQFEKGPLKVVGLMWWNQGPLGWKRQIVRRHVRDRETSQFFMEDLILVDASKGFCPRCLHQPIHETTSHGVRVDGTGLTPTKTYYQCSRCELKWWWIDESPRDLT